MSAAPPTPIQLPVKSNPIPLTQPKLHHIPNWGALSDVERLRVIRSIAMQRGRDPRIITQAVDIIRAAGVQPREYKRQAAALLKWVQNPKNVYYINEPGERLQDPLFTIRAKLGDCDDMALLLCAFFEAINLKWKLVLSGRQRGTNAKKRYIEGMQMPVGVNWAHIYCTVGTPPFNPTEWYFCEPTVQNVPLGWDVIDGDHSLLPEMGGSGRAPAARTTKGRFGDALPPSAASPAIRRDLLTPALNLRDVVKQMLLLEDHLLQPDRRCPDCIRKHLLKIEALVEEARSLDKSGACAPTLNALQRWGEAMQRAYAKNPGPAQFHAMSGVVRAARKRLTHHLASKHQLGALSGFGDAVTASIASAVATEIDEQRDQGPAGSPGTSTTSTWGLELNKLLPAITIGVVTSIVSALALDEIRAAIKQNRERV